MNATGYVIDTVRRLQEIPPDQVVAAWRAKDACVWLDLQGATPAEIEGWLDRLEFRGLARRICLEAGDRSGFYPLRNEMILVAPVLAGTGTETAPESDHVVFLCREGLLVTLHRQSVLKIHDQLTVAEAAEWLPERTVASLVAAILLDVTQAGLAHTVALRDAVDALEDRLYREPDSVEADEILDLRADLLVHEVVVSEQLPPVQSLNGAERSGLRMQGAREYLNCALANLQAADRRLDRLDSRVGEMRSGFQMHSQDKTNRRLGMLTILSAIFMPVTLMAGIWGMNFEKMPELGLTYGYPLALGAMVLVASGMFLFFRRGGWF